MRSETAYLSPDVGAFGLKKLKKLAKKAAKVAGNKWVGKALRMTGPIGAGIASGTSIASGLGRGKSLKRLAIQQAKNYAMNALGPAGRGALAAARMGVAAAKGKNMRAAALAEARREIGSLDDWSVTRERGRVSLFPADDTASFALDRDPTLLTRSEPELAAMGLSLRGQRSRIHARRLSPKTAEFVRARAVWAPMATSDVGALENGAGSYRVAKGDSAWAITQKLLGAGTRYRELFAANPAKPMDKKRTNWKYLNPGELLALPRSWAIEIERRFPAQTKPETVAATAIVSSKAILAAWAATDGASSPVSPNYGRLPEDGGPTWGARDKLALTAFSVWRNGKTGTALSIDGALRQPHVDELAKWATQRASAPSAPSAPATPSIPSLPSIPGIPGIPGIPSAPTFAPSAPPIGLISAALGVLAWSQGVLRI